jgi:hypothetical protein
MAETRDEADIRREQMMRSDQYRKFYDAEFDHLTTIIRDILNTGARCSGAMRDQYHHPSLSALTFEIGMQVMRITNPRDRQDAVERVNRAVEYWVKVGLREAENVEREMTRPLH